MATFSISISIEIDADSYEEAYAFEAQLTKYLLSSRDVIPEILSVSSIDVEQTSDDEGDEE